MERDKVRPRKGGKERTWELLNEGRTEEEKRGRRKGKKKEKGEDGNLENNNG